MHICGREKTIRIPESQDQNKQASKVNCQYSSPELLYYRARKCPTFVSGLTRGCIVSPWNLVPNQRTRLSATRPYPEKAFVFEDHCLNIFIMSSPVTSQFDSPGLTGCKRTAGTQRTHQALQKVQSYHRTIWDICAWRACRRARGLICTKNNLTLFRLRRDKVKVQGLLDVGNARALGKLRSESN